MKPRNSILFIWLLLACTSCEEEWLDVRRDKKQVVPQTLNDFQAMMDNVLVMNFSNVSLLGEAGADDYKVSYNDWQDMNTGISFQQRQAYIWGDPIYEPDISTSDWNVPYKAIFYANVALEGIAAIDPLPAEQEEWDNIKGSALFYRSWCFYQLAQVFCRQYDPSTAGNDPGIPLRLESDVNLNVPRSTVQETYNRILNDLQEAVVLLPDQPLERTRPGKAAANALLAKIYLQIGDHANALEAADKSLSYYNILMDYNTIDVNSGAPFDKLNEETVFYNAMNYVERGTLGNNRLMVVQELYDQYEDNDLRKSAFYYMEDDVIRYKGSYDNAGYFGMHFFGGIATDEVYLIRAECYSRAGNSSNAMADLNHLLSKRFEEGTFVPLTATDADEALEIILKERRKELVFRGIRWSDLRRLNQDPRFAKTLTRELNGEIYSIAPGDERYTLPIPDLVIQLTGMQQNPR